MSEPEFWINGDGQNMLSGVHGDETNPVMLCDEYLVEFLLHIPSARASYDRLFPTMLPEEQDRLSKLHDTAASHMFLDPVEASDRLQSTFNTAGVQRGGEWAPPPWRPPNGQ